MGGKRHANVCTKNIILFEILAFHKSAKIGLS
jgi:hypothetical protein